MSIASEIQALNTNLTAAKNAVTSAGGTVGDTGLAGLASEIGTIPTGGGGVSRPTTWAEFAAMTTAEQQQVYGVGDRVGLSCPFSATGSGTYYEYIWEIVEWTTTKKENDNTEYPCVVLFPRMVMTWGEFDAAETPLAATEETAQDGVYYFGYNGSTYTALNLSTGDTIPYNDYTAVYKTDLTNDATEYGYFMSYGCSRYKYSNIRQYLNSNGAINDWWQPSHIGDAAPVSATTKCGFIAGFQSADFKSILQKTEVSTYWPGRIGTGTDVVYDYFYLTQFNELFRGAFYVNGGGNIGMRLRAGTATGPSSTSIQGYWNRNANNPLPKVMYVSSNGINQQSYPSSTHWAIIPACKIILAG